MGWGVSGQCAFSLLLPGTYREVFPATAQLSTPLSSESEPLFAVDFSQPSSRPEASTLSSPSRFPSSAPTPCPLSGASWSREGTDQVLTVNGNYQKASFLPARRAEVQIGVLRGNLSLLGPGGRGVHSSDQLLLLLLSRFSHVRKQSSPGVVHRELSLR